MSDATTTERSRALFATAHQALLFAYTFSANQHAVTAAAERAIALQARERYAAAPVVSRGLGGLDGAAQAGMIKRTVEALGGPYRQSIEARFAVTDDGVKIRAQRQLTFFVRRRLRYDGCSLQLLAECVQRRYGARKSVQAMADAHGTPKRTVERWLREVLHILEYFDRDAMRRVELGLERSGICECVA